MYKLLEIIATKIERGTCELKKKLYIFICIIFLGIFTITFGVYGITIDEAISEKRNEIQTKIDNTTEQIEGVQNEIIEVGDELKELNERIAKYQQEINQLNVQALQIENNIKQIEIKLMQAEENYAKQKKLLEDRMIAMYKGGETLYLEVLLNSKNIEDFVSKCFYLSEVSKLDRQLVDRVKRQKEEIQLEKENLLLQKERLKDLTNNKERTSVTLQNTRVIRNSYLSELNDNELKLQNDLTQYETEMEQLEKSIIDISLSSMNEGYIGGKLLWPAPGYYTITSPFGMRIHPILHVYRLHTGVDIGSPKGADIVAANSGVVTVAKYIESYGNYVMIDHGGGIVTLYGHASELCVTTGDIVNAGDVIMKCGSTGWSTGPHLHFEIRIDGEPIDPLPYITNSSNNENTELSNPIENMLTDNTIMYKNEILNNSNIIN